MNVAIWMAPVWDNKYFEVIFEQNRAECRNWGSNMMGLQTNRIYFLINGLKTQRISVTSFEHCYVAI